MKRFKGIGMKAMRGEMEYAYKGERAAMTRKNLLSRLYVFSSLNMRDVPPSQAQQITH